VTCLIWKQLVDSDIAISTLYNNSQNHLEPIAASNSVSVEQVKGVVRIFWDVKDRFIKTYR